MVQEEPYGEEAFQFMRQLAMQRNVEMEIETVDRCGIPCGPPPAWLSSAVHRVHFITVRRASLEAAAAGSEMLGSPRDCPALLHRVRGGSEAVL